MVHTVLLIEMWVLSLMFLFLQPKCLTFNLLGHVYLKGFSGLQRLEILKKLWSSPSEPAASGPPGDSMVRQVLGPDPGPTESEPPGLGPRVLLKQAFHAQVGKPLA